MALAMVAFAARVQVVAEGKLPKVVSSARPAEEAQRKGVGGSIAMWRVAERR